MTFTSKYDLGSIVGYHSQDSHRIAAVTGVFFTKEGVLYEVDGIDEGSLLEEHRIEDVFYKLLPKILTETTSGVDLEGIAHV